MPQEPAMLVFSNLDDVLGHPSDEAWSDASKTLRGLEKEAVPLVLCSSKTRAEIEVILQALELQHPFVSEGGNAAFIPVGYFPFEVTDAREVAGYQAIELGRPYAEVVQILGKTADRQKIDVVGFGDMSVEEVARDCRLTLLQARLAKLREYGERFRFLDPSPATHKRLFTALEGAHLRCYGTECYLHVGAAVDPRLAVSVLCGLYKRKLGAVLSLGSADATAPFSDRSLAISSRVGHSGMTLVDWAGAIVDVVGRLRDRKAWQAQ